MSDWSKPTTTSNYSTEFIQQLDARLKDLAYGLDPTNVLSYVGLPSGAVRINWGGADISLQSYNGTTWTTIPKTINMNAATATVLATARNLVLNGDASATFSSFNGGANVTAGVTLTSVNATTTTVGSSTTIPVLAFDTKGRVTSVGSVSYANAITAGGSVTSSSITLQTGTGVTTLARLQSNALGTVLYLGDGTVVNSFSHDTLTATLQNKTLGTGCVWGGGTMGVGYGGTNLTSYVVGDLVYASGTSTLAKLADVATGNVLISGGVGVIPAYGKVGLTTHISGTLAVGNGGSGATTLTGILKGTGTTAFTAATAGDLTTLLGFTPIQQGTGTSQLGNVVKVGWSAASKLRLQVDSTDFADVWPISITGSATLAVPQDSGTGAAQLPSGTTGQQPTGAAGKMRFNTTLNKAEIHNGTAWGSVGGGATGGGNDDVFYENAQVINTNYTLTTGKNAMTAGPITINNGVTVTVPNGSVWSIV